MPTRDSAPFWCSVTNLPEEHPIYLQYTYVLMSMVCMLHVTSLLQASVQPQHNSSAQLETRSSQLLPFYVLLE